MKCANCGYDNPIGGRFCNQCGNEIEPTCPECGHINPIDSKFCSCCGINLTAIQIDRSNIPSSFIKGRYQVKRFLGEGGMKRVYLTRDMLLDRDVAFALLKTGTLSTESITRVQREAHIMEKLGDHKNILEIYEVGEHEGQPFFVMPFMSGGRVNDLIEKAPKHQLPIDQVIKIGKCVCQGLGYAHTQGIIHRDIKPSNIFIDSEGNAQIGDFGLAIIEEMSRLTTMGKTVGTPSYMSPEQVLGGDITFKSDLYSLGATLYEMVTGQPPFLGKDIATITSQHINIPPRLPTHLRPDIPSTLEAIIMQLLEKDPQYRPESSVTLFNTLESIELGDTKEIDSFVSSVLSGSRYHNQVFIGRENELKQLKAIYDGVTSGQGSIVTLVGNPGVGKSTLSEQLSTYARLRGGRVLYGYCYESMSLPYLPFIELIRSYLSSDRPGNLRENLENIAIDLARILPELQDTFHIRPQPLGDPQRERYQLMQAVISFLKIITRNQPVVLIIEDLHDADKGTLEMLIHVARSLWEIGILIICTYRDIELGHNNPLSETILKLERMPNYRQIKLSNFDSAEIRRLVKAITGQQVSRIVANILLRHTEGNPLFIYEVIRNLTEEIFIKRKEKTIEITEQMLTSISTPEQLRDVISKRLGYLSSECKHLLSIGAVIGREFNLEFIRNLVTFKNIDLNDLFKEAKSAMLLEERISMGATITYRFSHAFFRQVLYEDIGALERVDLHRQVANLLEHIYSENLEEHAVELVEHFCYSSDINDLSKAIYYGKIAAKQAEVVYAYSDAVRFLDRVVDVQKILNPDSKAELCDLLINLCDILLDVPDTNRVLQVEAPTAYSLATSIGDNSRAIRVCWSALIAIWGEQGGPGAVGEQWADWTKRAESLAKPDSQDSATVSLALGCKNCLTNEFKSGIEQLEKAFYIANREGDKEISTVAGINLLLYRTAPHHIDETRQLVDQLWTSRTGLRRYLTSSLLLVIGDTFLSLGQRSHAEEVFREIQTFAFQTGDFLVELGSSTVQAILLVINGQIEDAIKKTDEIRNLGTEFGTGGTGNVYARLASGRAHIYINGTLDLSSPPIPWATSLQLAYTGQIDRAIEELDNQVVKRPHMGTIGDETRLSVDTLNLEASVLLEHRSAAELLLNRLSKVSFCTSGYYFPTIIARHLGGAAAMLERYDEARQYYLEAIRIGQKMKFRPELALSYLQFIELMTKKYPSEKKEAMNNLDFVIKEFREMKMDPYLKKALEYKGILQQ